MHQTVEAVTNTCLKMAHDYGPWIAGAVLLIVGAGISLRIIARLLGRSPSGPSA
jgi:hypothetical protein